MKDMTTIKVSKEFRDKLADKMKKKETYEQYLKKFVSNRNE